jgi:hypothetical protein
MMLALHYSPSLSPSIRATSRFPPSPHRMGRVGVREVPDPRKNDITNLMTSPTPYAKNQYGRLD